MRKITYLCIILVLATLLSYVAKHTVKDLSPKSQIELDKARAEIENLRYQLNQCKVLYLGL